MLVHRFDRVLEIQKAIAEGTKPFYSIYILNPIVEAKDFRNIFIWFSVFTLLRVVLAGVGKRTRERCIFEKLLKPYIRERKVGWKFSENLWFLCWHLVSLAVGMCVLSSEAMTRANPGWVRMVLGEQQYTFLWHPTLAEQLINNDPGWPLIHMSSLTRHYYLLELGFWISNFVLFGFETKKKDFVMFLIHHSLTVFLITIAYTCSMWRLGILLLLAHDIADVLLYLSKTLHYSTAQRRATDWCFFAFALSFFVTRLLFLPLLSYNAVIRKYSWMDICARRRDVPFGVTLTTLLMLLQALHIVWFVMIVRMILRIFTKGTAVSQAGDIRSDEGSDKDE